MSKKKEITTGQEFKNTLELIFKYRVIMKPDDNEEGWEKIKKTCKNMRLTETRVKRIWKNMGLTDDEIEYGIGIVFYGKSSACTGSPSNSNS